jgi:hypothetical protein
MLLLIILMLIVLTKDVVSIISLGISSLFLPLLIEWQVLPGYLGLNAGETFLWILCGIRDK